MRNAVLFVLAVTGPTLAAQTRRPWREADLESLISVSEPALRPDGVQLVYVRGRADLAANLNRSEIVLVAAETGRVLTQWEGSSPRWSPSGREIAERTGNRLCGKPGRPERHLGPAGRVGR